MTKGIINKIIPFSSVDGPGNRLAIFLQGCNLNCLYCHNPETINLCNSCGACITACPSYALSVENAETKWEEKLCTNCDLCIKRCERHSTPKAKEMEVSEVLEEIKKVKPFISGITVSGGECTLQEEFLIELFKEVKKLGLTTFIDTNGTIELWNKPELLEVTDKFMIDFKAYKEEEHIKLTGKTNKNVFENIKKLVKKDKIFEIRTVIVPEVLSNELNVEMISNLIAELNENIRYKIIKYRSLGVREDIIKSHTPSDEMMENLKKVAEKNGCKDIVII